MFSTYEEYFDSLETGEVALSEQEWKEALGYDA